MVLPPNLQYSNLPTISATPIYDLYVQTVSCRSPNEVRFLPGGLTANVNQLLNNGEKTISQAPPVVTPQADRPRPQIVIKSYTICKTFGLYHVSFAAEDG